MTRTKPAEQRRAELLAAGQALFLAKGIAGTSLDDITQRGLLNNILLVITGEFGRTPRINGSSGRDHWSQLSTLALAGGGLKLGQVYGESNAKAEMPKTNPVSPQDLLATICHVVGIDPHTQFKDPSGRPSYVVESGHVLNEIVSD